MAAERKAGLFLGPALFLIVLWLPPQWGLSMDGWRVIAMAVLMLVWWVTEAVPIPVTSLLPMACLPLLGISDMKTAAAPYSNPVVFLFFGGFMIALAMERWQLHRRIALNIVQWTGTNANGIILGFMLATAFVSMWISNTATTLMMLPIAVSVVGLLTKEGMHNKGMRNFALCLMLGIAYASSIGGTATLVGTPPNVVFKGFIQKTYGVEVSFLNWLLLAFPFSVVLLASAYWLLVKVFYPNKLGAFEDAQDIISAELKQLGSMQKGEKRTLVIFSATALLWITGSLLNAINPWFQLTDELVAVLAVVALFVVPVDFKKGEFVMNWSLTERMPWGILLLFGGGLSLADALAKTGVIGLIGSQFEGMAEHGFWLLLGLTAVSLFLTEVMSNVALVTIFLPVVAGIAQGAGTDPIQVCAAVTMAASCAFMLPMSTPPNAIVFASGHIRMSQMVKVGLILNLITVAAVALLIKTLLPLLF